MDRQASTAISDFILAVSGLWGFREMQDTIGKEEHRFAKWWFMLVAMAAALGVVRFAVLMPNHHSTVQRYHKNFSWLSRAIGIPCLASEICNIAGFPIIGQGFLFSAVATFICSALGMSFKDRLTELLSTLAVISIIVFPFIDNREMVGIGGLLMAFGGIASNMNDTYGLDILHYSLAAANICIANGISK